MTNAGHKRRNNMSAEQSHARARPPKYVLRKHEATRVTESANVIDTFSLDSGHRVRARPAPECRINKLEN